MFHILLSSQDFPLGIPENPKFPAQSRDRGVPIMARLQAALFCNSSAFPPSSGKEVTVLIYKLRNQMPLPRLVGKQAQPPQQPCTATYGKQSFTKPFVHISHQADSRKTNYGQGYLISDPQPLALPQESPEVPVSIPSHTQMLSPARLSVLGNISVLFPGNGGCRAWN